MTRICYERWCSSQADERFCLLHRKELRTLWLKYHNENNAYKQIVLRLNFEYKFCYRLNPGHAEK